MTSNNFIAQRCREQLLSSDGMLEAAGLSRGRGVFYRWMADDGGKSGKRGH